MNPANAPSASLQPADPTKVSRTIAAGTPAPEAPGNVPPDIVSTHLPGNVKVAKTFPIPGVAFCVVSSHQPSQYFFGASDFRIHRISIGGESTDPVRLSEAGHDSYVTGLIRAGDVLISGSYDGSLIWWRVDGGELIRRVPAAHSRWIRRIAVSPDGSRAASVGDDMKTKLWDVATGECQASWGDYPLKTPQGYPSMLYSVTFSADGKWLATGNRTGRVIVRDLSTGRIEATLETPVMYTWDATARQHSIGGIRSLAFSGDSTLLAVGGMGHVGNIDHLEGTSRIEIFAWPSGKRLHEIEDSKYKGLVESLRFGPSNEWLVAAGGDSGGFISVYSMSDARLLSQEKMPMHVHDFELDAAGTTLLAVGHGQGAIVSLAAGSI